MKSETELIHQYAEKKRSGMSYGDIRKELGEKGFDTIIIDSLIKQIDDQIITSDLNSVEGSIRKEYKYFAWVLVLFSVITSIVAYYYSVFFVSTGLLIGGVTILFLMRGRKHTNIFQDPRDKYPRNKYRRK